jgi:predicted transcriptional regulator
MKRNALIKKILKEIEQSNLINLNELSSKLGTNKESIQNSLLMLISNEYLEKRELDSLKLCTWGCCKISESTIKGYNSKYILSLTKKGRRFLIID